MNHEICKACLLVGLILGMVLALAASYLGWHLGYARIYARLLGVVKMDTLIEIELDLGKLSACRAEQSLKRISGELKIIHSRDLRCRILLGRVLVEIQDRELWKPAHETWRDFLTKGFPTLTGLKDRTAYDAMDLAKSEVLGSLAPGETDKIMSVSNARRIARMERAGAAIGPEVIEQAQTLPTREFHEATGAVAGTVVQIWSSDNRVAAALQRLLQILVTAGAEALEALLALLEDPRMTGYAGVASENKLDAILGALVTITATELVEDPQEVPAIEDGDSVPAPELPDYVRRTGLEIILQRGRQQPFVAYGYNGSAHPAAFGSGETALAALEELRVNRLNAIITQKMRDQDYRCAHCAKVVSLQPHHIIFRSHGGTDTPENIECVCAACHHKKHKMKYKGLDKFGEQPEIRCL